MPREKERLPKRFEKEEDESVKYVRNRVTIGAQLLLNKHGYYHPSEGPRRYSFQADAKQERRKPDNQIRRAPAPEGNCSEKPLNLGK